MTFRIHFTTEDLARTHVASAPGPLLELDIALRVLQRRSHCVRFGAWRREVSAQLRPQARMVLDLVSVMNWSPTCLLPSAPGEPQELLEHRCADSGRLLRQELAAVVERRGHRLPTRVAQVGQDPGLLRRLYQTVGEVYEQVLAPYWPQVADVIAADRALRMRELLDGGAERLLSGLSPRHIRWDPPVLSLATADGYDGELRLEGRGLLLVPTMFGAEAPIIAPHAQPQPVMTYPARLGEGPEALVAAVAWQSTPSSPKPLADLLGRTRAVVLCVIAERPGITTGELSTRAGIAPASASEHAAVLRRAGLIASARRRNTVLHSPTTAGLALLNAPNGTGTSG
ncbi:ArsR/SmtB family transcription factor [Streptomyces sp. NPDC059063]|uniref:ArsR/SmtB family transcription factor n=1 Tax=unclassified Streptomyces TaxID=2593676 RepID=UPI0036BFD236